MTTTDIREQLREEVKELKELREADHRLIAIQHTLIEELKGEQATLTTVANCLNTFKKTLSSILWALIVILVLLVVLLLC